MNTPSQAPATSRETWYSTPSAVRPPVPVALPAMMAAVARHTGHIGTSRSGCLRLLHEEGDMKVSVGDNQIAFELNESFLVSKLIEGNYPNYRQVIPSEAKERVTLERETFLNAARRVSLLASEKSNSVKLIFTKGNIDIVANTPDVGEAK